MLVRDLFESSESLESVANEVYSAFASAPEARSASARRPVKEGNQMMIEFRHWGSWEMPQGEEDDGDYDWEVPTDATGRAAEKIAADLRKKFPKFTIEFSFEEKKYMMVFVKAKAVKENTMKVSELFSAAGKPVNEDWGSSDWYPVMKAMARNIHAGMNMHDAAYEAAVRYKDMMGYEDTADGDEDMIHATIHRWAHISPENKKKFMDEAAGKKVTEAADPKTMSRAEIEKELDKLEGMQYDKMEKWERQRRAELRVALKNMDTPPKTKNKAGMPSWHASAPISAAERAEAKKAEKEEKEKLDSQLYHKVVDAIGNSFPDGDPMDHFMDWMDRKGLDMKDVDRVFKKYEGKSYYRYLANMWDDYAGDNMADANSEIAAGKKPASSAFYHWDGKSKKVTKEKNPWK